MRRKKNVLIITLLVVVTLGTLFFYIIKQKGYTKNDVESSTVKNNNVLNDQDNENKKPELTTVQKLEDLNYAYNILKDNFPFFEVEKRKTGFDWLGNKESFENQIKETKNDIEFYNRMKEIFRAIQNQHTYILDPYTYNNKKSSYNDKSEWNKVVSSNRVVEKYKLWEEMSNKQVSHDIFHIPIVFIYAEGKYYAINLFNYQCEKYGISEGAILNKINGSNPEVYIKSLMSDGYLSYDFKREKLKANMFDIATNKDEIFTLTFETPSGETIEKTIKAEKYIEDKNSFNHKTKDNVETEVLIDKKVAYMKIRGMESDYRKDQQNIINFIDNIKEYPYLVIDIRDNGGGDDHFWEYNLVAPLINSKLSIENHVVFKGGKYINPFLQEKLRILSCEEIPITKLPENKNYAKEIYSNYKGFITWKREVSPLDKIDFKGKIYLLVNDGVYSAAESFAAFAKDTKWATLVGSNTGGDGIIFDPAIASMPNSGLVFSFSQVMGLNTDGTANEETHTAPDIYEEISGNDIIKYMKWKNANRNEIINPYDTVLNKVLDMTH
jgi:C-terminal processing protease CtpA/Prc